ncbi:uncharacterized protein LOC127848192 isoform X5 [Dreissena polymorpha]|uniref:uncharacterized protein LOC127848192 isoform X3 n=1 Tax=Dreissena polymorpha TaxID=45954 RepID=UPI002263F5C0|nr:uncharacterized protein LOC127848192 isoform X3 [Dreissena polymorpha]XP_052236460.1 uncharacterized protein LOC127848192 isoform X5 [Dreissena polymorpha]
MLRNIGNVACFIVVLMTSHHVTGQSHDVAQFNRRLTIIKNSVEYDIADIRLEVKELKMIVEQIVGGQSNTSDGSVIGQGMTDLNQREITDLKNKLNAHESRLNRLFSSVNEIQDENTALKNKVNQFFEEKENGVKTELLKLNAGIETKFDDIVNVLQIKFEETTAAMMKGYKDLKTHVNVKVSVVDQINNLAQSVISEQNKLSSRLDQAVKKLEVNELVEKRERKELINNLKAELLLLNAGVETKIDDRVNALQKRFEESTTANLAGYKYLETHMSVQMKNLTQSVISEQNKLSARMDQADAHIVRMKAKTDKCCIDCGDPTPDHGTVNTTATTFGTVVKIACNHGYVLSGANIAKCNADSVWSDSATCNLYDCGNASPANGVATAPNGTTYQKQANVQCNPGYALNGSSLIECSATGWNDSVQCVIQNCGDPTPDHGTVNTTATTFGTVVKIACNHGYVLSGANIAKCNADSVWSDSATCNPYDCGNASPANGVATAPKGTTYQKQAYVQCNPGYALNGSSLIECSAAGWNDSVQCVIQTMCDAKPDCSDGADELNCKTCDPLLKPINGNVAFGNITARFTFDAPHCFDKNKTHVCNKGQFDDTNTIFLEGLRECFTDEYLVKNDSTLSVSSQWNQNETDMFGADQGRLNSTETGEGTSFRAGIWAAGVADTNQYIQVNFTSSKIITGIVTRGRPQSPKPQNAQWVKQYRFMYSRDCETFNTYTHTNGSDMLFDANDDGKTIRPNQLPCPVLALCARVNPTLWHGYISMQFDVRGCDGPI